MRAIKSTTWFTRFTKWTGRMNGRPVTFVVAVAVILGWALTGPVFGYTDTWQIIINSVSKGGLYTRAPCLYSG
jgi:low affinity Fe/Cu permease